MSENTNLENLQKRLEEAKGDLEHLQMQLNLGKSDAVDAFEEHKQELSDKLDEVKGTLEEISELGEERSKPMLSRLEDLRVQLALGKADSLTAYREQEKKLNQAIFDFKQEALKTLDEAEDRGEERVAESLSLLNERTTEFRTRMEMFRVQLALGEAEARDEWGRVSEEFGESAREIMGKLEKQVQAAEGRAAGAGEKAIERFYDLKNTFFGLFK